MSMINLTVCHLKCCHRDHSLEQPSIFMTKKKRLYINTRCSFTSNSTFRQPFFSYKKNVEDQFRISDSLIGLIYFQNFCWNGTILSHTAAPIQQKKKNQLV